MNDEEWAIEMRAIVDYAYGEDWIESEKHLPHSMWESRYNDVAKGYNALTAWLLENEPEVWETLKPLTLEWTKGLVWGPDYMFVDSDCVCNDEGFEEYKKQLAGCDD